MSGVDVVVEVEIACPRDRVTRFAADPDNVPRWYENIRSVDWQTPRPLALGSQIGFVAQFLGRRLEYTYEVVEWRPGRCLVMRTAQGPFPMETSYIWQSVGESRTRMTLRNRGQPAGFSALVAPFMSWMMRRAMEKDLARLKRLLESGDR